MKRRPLLLIALLLTLLALPACGDDGGSILTTTPGTSAVTTTTALSSTTTAPGVTTTVPKPEDDRVDGLALAGGFNAGSTPVTVPPDDATTTGYSDYVTITDDSGILKVDVPVEWDEVNGSPWTENIFGLDGTDGIGVALSASSDRQAWIDTWGTPGVFFGATDQLTGTIDDVLDAYGYIADQCTYDARYAYDDGTYTGSYDWWTDCGGVGTVYVVIAARPAGGEFTAVVEITMVSEADLEVADKIVGSYYVVDPTGSSTGGGALDPNLEPNYGSGDLAPGFTPDPEEISVQAGGTIDVSAYLGGECAGFVTEAPDLQLTWTGTGATPIRFYFVAAEAGADTVLVINDPNGEWWCGDDSYGGLNPTIEFAAAPAGVYDIWVGTYTADALIAGTFYVTEVDANHP